MDQFPRFGKRELICLLLFTCNYMVSVWRGFLFLWVLGMGYVILLWHSLSLPYNYSRRNLTRKAPNTTIAEFASTVELDKMAHNELFRPDLLCLRSSL